jgi:hypothetical protein
MAQLVTHDHILYHGVMRSQRGNILFLILLAVVLFAALAYAVTSSMRGGGKNAGAENVQAAVAGMIQFMTDVETFITRARMIDNVKDEDFTFQVNATSNNPQNYQLSVGGSNCWIYNANCTRSACRVFKPWNPDGIAAQAFEKYVDPNSGGSSQGKAGHFDVKQVIIPNIGTNAPELVAMIGGLKAEICNEINRQQGLITNYTNNTAIEDIGETAATSRPDVLASTCGGNAVLNSTRVFGDEAMQFAGRRTFCAPYINSGNGVGSKLALWHVIIER